MSLTSTIQSEFLSLSKNDFVKGAILAGLTVIAQGIITILNTGAFPTSADLESMLKVAGIAVASYLVKNLFTNSPGTPLASEPKPTTP